MSTLGTRLGYGRTAEIFAWDNGRIVKLFYAGYDRNSITFEADVGRRLFATGLPVPRIDDVVEVEGRTGIIAERIDGDLLVQPLRRSPWRAAYVGRVMADLQAAVHAVTLADLPAASARLAWQIEHAPADLPDRARERALHIVADLPADQTVCHGDFHPENVIMTHERAVIIDWTNIMNGPPALDVARTALLIAIGQSLDPLPLIVRGVERLVRTVLLNTYLKRYFAQTNQTRADLAGVALPVLAARFNEPIPTENTARLRAIQRLLADDC